MEGEGRLGNILLCCVWCLVKILANVRSLIIFDISKDLSRSHYQGAVKKGA